MSLKAFLPVCLLLLSPVAAQAQYQMVSPMLYGGARISLEAHAASGASARSAPPVATRPLDAASLKFQPDLARRKANLARFVARSRETDRAAGDSLAAIFAQGDVFELMGPRLAKYGLAVDSVADAYTVWWIAAWQASRGIDDDVSAATAAAVRRQFLQAAATAPQITGAKAGDKQDMSESLLIQAAILSTAVSQAKTDPKQMQRVKTGALRAGQEMGVDLSGMELTAQGFVFRAAS